MVTTLVLDETTLDELRRTLRGQVVIPGDADYDAVRTLNAMIDKRPAVSARCAGAADVKAALDIGRRSGLELAASSRRLPRSANHMTRLPFQP